MLKKFGVAGLVLGAGLLFVHPSAGNAQSRYQGGYSYFDNRSNRDYRDYERQRFREERQARKWQEKELRERQRWERQNFRNYYNGYRNDGYPNYRYRNPYRGY
jgi:hypothetical protein